MSLVRIYTTSSKSPIISLYGDAGDHETILRYLDGWYSTPDAKVILTERASGDGAHDVAESDIIYGTRTIVVDYRILTDSRTRLLAHESSLLSLAHQQVRFRVTDDDSDLVASGYVDSVVKDKSQQNIAKQTETGTLTIICPRPERLAWSPLQSQLFPVSMVQGGLLYSTVPKLVSAWTGTADASTSTLSQGGSVVATQYMPNPAWKASGTPLKHWLNGSVTYRWADANGFCLVPDGANSIGPYVEQNISGLPADSSMILRLEIVGGDTGTARGNLVSITDSSGTTLVQLPFLVTQRVNTLTFTVPSDGQIIIKFRGMLEHETAFHDATLTTADGWDAMQALGVDWFSGDSYPVPTGNGLSYPLNYGTGGITSNVVLLLNQGSSKAYPVLTVTGNFQNGVQIQWGGNALQYDGAIGAVPLILDSRSQTASMGGVDVSRNLSRRDFPTVPADGSVSLLLMSAGTGWVTAVCRDTYI